MADPQSSSSTLSLRQILLGTVAVAGIAVVGYAVWFDHARRSDPAFRKKLAAEKKRAAKAKAAAEQAQKEAKAASAEQAKSALSSMAADDEPIPTEPEAREQYFMENLQKGEALFRQGPEYFEMSAMSFYRAMKVYPNPMDLLVLFQRSVPEPVFNMLMELMAADIKKKQEEYFDTYPKREMNVKITQSIDNQTLKRGLEALEDFEEGQVIFSEEPLVAAIDPALESGTFCSFCAKQFAEGEEAVVDEDFDKWVYCCAVCYKKARDEYNQFISGGPKAALIALFDYCRDKNVKYPMMITRFLGRMVAEEKARAAEAAEGTPSDEISIWEHVDKLQYMDLKSTPEDQEEARLVTELMAQIQPGFEEFFTEERYLMLKGKMLYNAYAIQTVEPPFAPASTENVRIAHAEPSPIGAGLYHIASYAAHSCEPSARVEFRAGTNTLALVAAKPIKTGEPVTVAYAPVTGIESTEERQALLAKGFRFKCECPKCGAADGIDE